MRFVRGNRATGVHRFIPGGILARMPVKVLDYKAGYVRQSMLIGVSVPNGCRCGVVKGNGRKRGEGSWSSATADGFGLRRTTF